MSMTADVTESPNTRSIMRKESVSFSLVLCWYRREINLLKTREAALGRFGDKGRLEDIAVGVLAGKVYFRKGRKGSTQLGRDGDSFEVVKNRKVSRADI